MKSEGYGENEMVFVIFEIYLKQNKTEIKHMTTNY